MSITLYNCNAEPNRVDKSSYLSEMLTINNYTLLEDSNNHQPNWIVDSNSNIMNANYAYWSEIGRYYFINVTTINNSIYRINGNVDVLHTYRNAIKSSKGIAIRCNKENRFLSDVALSTQSDIQWEQKLFPKELSKSLTNILITIGGSD